MKTIKELKRITGRDINTLRKTLKDLGETSDITMDSTIDDTVFNKVCSEYGISYGTQSDNNDRIIVEKSLSRDTQVKVVTQDRNINVSKSKYYDILTEDYDSLKAEEISHKDILRKMKAYEKTLQNVLEKAKKNKKQFKTIIGSSQVKDNRFIQTLLGDYKFIVVPANMPKKMKMRFVEMCLAGTISAEFNNKIIAVKDDITLTVFIRG